MIGSQAGLTLAGQDEDTPRLKYAAKSAGYSEIEIHLNPETKHQSAGAISGCKVLRVYPAGTDLNNMPKFDFVVGDGDINFAFDESRYAMVAYLLDDKERGTVSPVGYNRDLLASHTDLFIVPDPDVKADIEKRAEKMRVRAAEKEEQFKNEKVSEDFAPETVEDIDAQMANLQKKKDAMTAAPPKSNAPIPGNKPPEVPKTKASRGRPKKTPEEKAAWGAQMKAAREAKAKARATIAPLPKEENAVHETVSPVVATE